MEHKASACKLAGGLAAVGLFILQLNYSAWGADSKVMPTPQGSGVAIHGSGRVAQTGPSSPYRGGVLDTLPENVPVVRLDRQEFSYLDGTFYIRSMYQGYLRYVGVRPPNGLVVPTLPPKCATFTVDNTEYFWDRGVAFTLNLADNKPSYVVTAVPEQSNAFAEPNAPEAFAVLRRSNNFLNGANRVSFTATEIVSGADKSGALVRRSLTRTFVAQRPDRLRVDSKGDGAQRVLWYSNKQIAVVDFDKCVYATMEAPATIDEAIEFAVERYGIAVPAARFLQTGFCDIVERQATKVAYLGMSNVGATACHRVKFNFSGMTWQLWIDAGDKPLPRRLISLGGSEGRNYVATFDRWEIDPTIAPDAFVFLLPKGAAKIDIVPLNPDITAETPATQPAGK